MLLHYEISAPDLGSALNIAAKRAQNDGYTHTSVQATQQTGRGTWLIVVFGSNSQGVTQRGPGWVDDTYGGHWCGAPALCRHNSPLRRPACGTARPRPSSRSAAAPRPPRA